MRQVFFGIWGRFSDLPALETAPFQLLHKFHPMLAANPFFDAAAMICDRIEMEALSVRNLLGLYIYIYMYRN